MSFEYRFGDGVQYKYEKPMRKIITLDPAYQKLTAQSHMFEKQESEAAGLGEFAKQGYGVVIAVRSRGLEHGMVVLYTGMYQLTADELCWC